MKLTSENEKDLKADIELCRKYIFEILETGKMPCLCVPPETTDFDIQIMSALDELEKLRGV